MKPLLMIPLILTLALTGCNERENPLKFFAANDVAQWVFKHKSPDINNCATIWDNQAIALQVDLEECAPTAQKLAALLSKGGFGDVQPNDVLLPTIWGPYNTLLSIKKRNTYDPQKAGEAMRLPTDNSLKNRIDAYKKERDKANSP